MTPRRRDRAPRDLITSLPGEPRSWLFAFFSRSDAYRRAFSISRTVRLRARGRSRLTLWRYTISNRCAERLGLRHWPASHRSARPIAPAAFASAACGGRWARLKPPAGRYDPNTKTLADLPGAQHLVLTPGRPAALYLTYPGGAEAPCCAIQLVLLAPTPLLFGRFRLSIETPFDRVLPDALTETALISGAQEAAPRLRLKVRPARLALFTFVFDLKGFGLSHRQVTIRLFGEKLVNQDWYADSYLKTRIDRLVRQARRYVSSPRDLVR